MPSWRGFALAQEVEDMRGGGVSGPLAGHRPPSFGTPVGWSPSSAPSSRPIPTIDVTVITKLRNADFQREECEGGSCSPRMSSVCAPSLLTAQNRFGVWRTCATSSISGEEPSLHWRQAGLGNMDPGPRPGVRGDAVMLMEAARGQASAAARSWPTTWRPAARPSLAPSHGPPTPSLAACDTGGERGALPRLASRPSSRHHHRQLTSCAKAALR